MLQDGSSVQDVENLNMMQTHHAVRRLEKRVTDVDTWDILGRNVVQNVPTGTKIVSRRMIISVILMKRGGFEALDKFDQKE